MWRRWARWHNRGDARADVGEGAAAYLNGVRMSEIANRRLSSRVHGRLLTVAIAAGLVALLAGCSSAGGLLSPIDPNPLSEMMKPTVVTSVKDGDKGVSPRDPITVTVADGQISKVTLTDAHHKTVGGEIAADGKSWHSTGPLGYDTEYTLESTSNGLGGASTNEIEFTTTTPDNLTKPYLNVGGDETVGIAQTIGIQFDENIPDRHAVENAITVETTPHVDGAFFWLSNREVRWRPQDFWAPGTKVKVSVDVFGKDLGGGLFGQEDISDEFNIGDSVILVADDNTKQVTVSRNGEVIMSMPTSMGKDSTPTPNGTYILAEHLPSVIMDSSTYGVPVNSPEGYRETIQWATRMSYNGIYLHSAPWSLSAQGNTNTSHGCLNLSPDNAMWVYNNTRRGDVVIVQNTVGGTLSGYDGLGDWNIPWSMWQKGNADEVPS
ncbi:Ig-like domain-containing protein [Smaragdicoccus niigatensis]